MKVTCPKCYVKNNVNVTRLNKSIIACGKCHTIIPERIIERALISQGMSGMISEPDFWIPDIPKSERGIS